MVSAAITAVPFNRGVAFTSPRSACAGVVPAGEGPARCRPRLPGVVSGSMGIVDTIKPIRRLCPHTNLYTRMIESIDLKRRRVVAAAGFGSQQLYLEYDHLVIALGNVTSFAGQPGLA